VFFQSLLLFVIPYEQHSWRLLVSVGAVTTLATMGFWPRIMGIAAALKAL
jgi:hypothetical protein